MILGIDPGLDGALALYQPSVGTIHEILDMPTFSLKRGKTNKREIDLDGVVQFLTTHREGISPFDILQPAYAALYSGAFHPTAEGHAIVADHVMRHVRSVLDKEKKPVLEGRLN